MRFLLLLSAVFCFSAQAEWNIQCGKFPKPLDGGYCVHLPKQNPSGDIVYHLHGNNQSERTFQEEWYYTAQLRTWWKNNSSKLPTVVSISFGPTWLLAEKNSSPYSGLLDVMTTRVIPMIEQKLGGLKGRRMIFGESMGGFNSAQLALKTNLFHRAAILCSPMAPVSPFDSEKTIRDYVESTSAWQYYKDHNPEAVLSAVNMLRQLTTAFYPTPEEWLKGDPLALAQAPANPLMDLYVAIGFYDRYAAYEANEMFVQRLKTRQVNVDWRPQWGGHCAMDIPSLAHFLVR